VTAREFRRAAKKAAQILGRADKILILSHTAPDGDTIGAAYALCSALQKMGKKARTECGDILPAKYEYLFSKVDFPAFEPELVVAVDVASKNLIGDALSGYQDRVALCIDHHPSNTFYAGFTLLDPDAAATCELIYYLLGILNVKIDRYIAECIYTGVATDTGCFRFSNTTPTTLRVAAEMIERGADSATINKILFDTVSRERLRLETLALETLEYHFGGAVAIVCVSLEMCKTAGVTETDLEGLPSLPIKIEGVAAGVTIKEKEDGVMKISLRTTGAVNASQVCASLGGGGHARAAGCQVEGTMQEAREKILEELSKYLGKK